MIDVLIIGAGIVGSWLALESARRGLVTAVCDKSPSARDGITGRNSGVLHAGLYYTPGSLKARYCIEGRELALEFARKYDVPHSVCGKLIVSGSATDDQPDQSRERLERLYQNALACGARNLEIIQIEPGQYPHILGKNALHSGSTAVIDVPSYHRTVRQVAEEAGAMFLMGREFKGLDDSGARIELQGDSETEVVEAAHVINAGGLDCDRIADLFGMQGYEIRPNRGEYYRLSKNLPFDKLVYPLPPDKNSTALGGALYFSVKREAYAGPNSVWADSKSDYQISASPKEFYESLGRITDFYKEADLQPGYSGLRPRLFKNETAIKDFVIEKQSHENLQAWHMLGIESPGLTSSPSLARMILDQIQGLPG